MSRKLRETRKILRWKPEVELRVGIAEVVKDFVMRADEEGRRKNPPKAGPFRRASQKYRRKEKKVSGGGSGLLRPGGLRRAKGGI